MQNYSTKHPLSSFCVLFGFNSTTNTQFIWKIYTHTHTHTHTYTHSSFILIIHWYIKYYRSNRQLFVSWYYMSHNNNLFTQQKWITLNFDWGLPPVNDYVGGGGHNVIIVSECHISLPSPLNINCYSMHAVYAMSCHRTSSYINKICLRNSCYLCPRSAMFQELNSSVAVCMFYCCTVPHFLSLLLLRWACTVCSIQEWITHSYISTEDLNKT